MTVQQHMVIKCEPNCRNLVKSKKQAPSVTPPHGANYLFSCDTAWRKRFTSVPIFAEWCIARV